MRREGKKRLNLLWLCSGGRASSSLPEVGWQRVCTFQWQALSIQRLLFCCLHLKLWHPWAHRRASRSWNTSCFWREDPHSDEIFQQHESESWSCSHFFDSQDVSSLFLTNWRISSSIWTFIAGIPDDGACWTWGKNRGPRDKACTLYILESWRFVRCLGVLQSVKLNQHCLATAWHTGGHACPGLHDVGVSCPSGRESDAKVDAVGICRNLLSCGLDACQVPEHAGAQDRLWTFSESCVKLRKHEKAFGIDFNWRGEDSKDAKPKAGQLLWLQQALCRTNSWSSPWTKFPQLGKRRTDTIWMFLTAKGQSFFFFQFSNSFHISRFKAFTTWHCPARLCGALQGWCLPSLQRVPCWSGCYLWHVQRWETEEVFFNLHI